METVLQKAQVTQIIASNPSLTLGEIINEALRQHLLRITRSTLDRYLKVLLMTRKVMRAIPLMRNDPRAKPKPQLYCELVLENQQMEYVFLMSLVFGSVPSVVSDEHFEEDRHAALLRSPDQRMSRCAWL
jgi:hypothetical protein